MADAQNLGKFLQDLKETLADLEQIQEQRRTALRGMDTDELESLAHSEGECALRARRALACQDSADESSTLGAIHQLRRQLECLPPAEREQLREQLACLRDHAEVVREMLAANWLVTYRMNQHVQGILEILSCDDSEFGDSDEGTGLYLDHRA
jgi:hypothetical protein